MSKERSNSRQFRPRAVAGQTVPVSRKNHLRTIVCPAQQGRFALPFQFLTLR